MLPEICKNLYRIRGQWSYFGAIFWDHSLGHILGPYFGPNFGPYFGALLRKPASYQTLSPFTSPQVLTQEDWNTVMYDGMRATSKWAALYFILMMTIGNYILFNLLVAILVEGFANQPVSASTHCHCNKTVRQNLKV